MTTEETLSDWLSTYAKPLPDTHWLAQLKKTTWHLGGTGFYWCDVHRAPEGQQAQAIVPPKCLAMEGFGREFRRFDVQHALARSEYFKILDRVIAFAREDEAEPDSDIDVETEDVLFLDHVPDNPFKFMRTATPNNIIITGSPGNGKTLFLHLLLRLRLNAKLPTLLQDDLESAVLVTEYGPYRLKRATLENVSAADLLGWLIPNMWCLVDSDMYMQIPSLFVTETRCTIVQTPSPRAPRMDWVKKRGAPLMEFCMAPFTLEEAVVACQFQQLPTANERQLEYWYQRFTPSFRTAYAHGRDPQSYEDEIKMELRRVPDATTLSAIGSAVNCANIPLHQHTPYEIFLYFPQKDHQFLDATVAIPTSYLASLIIDRFKATTTVKRLELYRLWLGIGPLAAATGRLLEHLVEEALPKGGVYPLKKLQIQEKPVYYHWTAPSESFSTPDHYLVIDGGAEHTVTITTEQPHDTRTRSPVEIKFYENLESDVLADGAFYFPLSATAPRFGFIHVQGHKAVLFQCTVSGKHDVKKVWLDKVIDLAKKLNIKEIAYMGVVPKGEESTTFAIKKELVQEIPFNSVGQYLLPYEPVDQA